MRLVWRSTISSSMSLAKGVVKNQEGRDVQGKNILKKYDSGSAQDKQCRQGRGQPDGQKQQVDLDADSHIRNCIQAFLPKRTDPYGSH